MDADQPTLGEIFISTGVQGLLVLGVCLIIAIQYVIPIQRSAVVAADDLRETREFLESRHADSSIAVKRLEDIENDLRIGLLGGSK